MAKFSEGQKVIVRSGFSDESHPNIGWADEFSDLVGKSATVIDVVNDRNSPEYASLLFDDGQEWCWPTDCLVSVDDITSGVCGDAEYSPTWQQAVRDFALQFISEYEPRNAADIAAAAITFTGGDDV